MSQQKNNNNITAVNKNAIHELDNDKSNSNSPATLSVARHNSKSKSISSKKRNPVLLSAQFLAAIRRDETLDVSLSHTQSQAHTHTSALTLSNKSNDNTHLDHHHDEDKRLVIDPLASKLAASIQLPTQFLYRNIDVHDRQAVEDVKKR